MAAHKIAILTFISVAVFANAGKKTWDDYLEEHSLEGNAESSAGSERNTMSLVQLVLTDEEQSHRATSENEQRQDAASKNFSQRAAVGALAVAQAAAMSVSNAASFAADIATATASNALSNASSRLEESSVQVAKAAEDAMSEASVRFFDASDQRTFSHNVAAGVPHQQIRRHEKHQAGSHYHAGATDYSAMHPKEGHHSVHRSWSSLLWSVLHILEELILRETVALRAAILIACLVAVKVLHHHHMNSVGHAATLNKSFWSKTPVDQQQDELTAQTLAAGRAVYSREVQPDRPDLYEPSPFHKDKDPRRVVMGGE
eukprot:TRINITY_DN27405_c0_g1_i1.p1 TRINITY_DN27405_c0_g1~~TRINITY_DN27405_c0_g1_i1.p1  ORF type:complete len:316 (+),score=73.76 TRINITY_DN27405_c0_g1_i1:130-1077(+)